MPASQEAPHATFALRPLHERHLREAGDRSAVHRWTAGEAAAAAAAGAAAVQRGGRTCRCAAAPPARPCRSRASARLLARSTQTLAWLGQRSQATGPAVACRPAAEGGKPQARPVWGTLPRTSFVQMGNRLGRALIALRHTHNNYRAAMPANTTGHLPPAWPYRLPPAMQRWFAVDKFAHSSIPAQSVSKVSQSGIIQASQLKSSSRAPGAVRRSRRAAAPHAATGADAVQPLRNASKRGAGHRCRAAPCCAA